MLAEVNLNLYKYFFAVIEERSVSKAAEKLKVSQQYRVKTVNMLVINIIKYARKLMLVLDRKYICTIFIP